MKNKTYLLIIALTCALLSISGCKKDGERFDPAVAGQNTFWTDVSSYGEITVTCEGRKQVITYSHSSLPDCGDKGCATFNLMPGTYSYEASGSYRGSWEGEITVRGDGRCSTMRLY